MLILDMFKIVGNFYDWNHYDWSCMLLVVLRGCRNLIFEENVFEIILYLSFHFIQKTEKLALEKLS